jgi:hypothetical protein
MNIPNPYIELTRSDDPETLMADKITRSLWDDSGYLPDPVNHAFREAIVKIAMEICHECGTEQATVDFCVKTISDWLKYDKPTKLKNNEITWSIL